MKNHYKVYIFCQNNVSIEESHTDETIASCLDRLLRGPSRLIINEIKVVDQLDCVNFLYKNGKIIFPKQNRHG